MVCVSSSSFTTVTWPSYFLIRPGFISGKPRPAVPRLVPLVEENQFLSSSRRTSGRSEVAAIERLTYIDTNSATDQLSQRYLSPPGCALYCSSSLHSFGKVNHSRCSFLVRQPSWSSERSKQRPVYGADPQMQQCWLPCGMFCPRAV